MASLLADVAVLDKPIALPDKTFFVFCTSLHTAAVGPLPLVVGATLSEFSWCQTSF
jgi:hypothetical protein